MIRDIWIVEKRGGRCLFNKSYGQLNLDPDLISSFLSGLNAFSEAELGDTGIESIEMGNMKWVYINWKNKLLLVAAADKNADSLVLHHQLDIIRKDFMGFFNIDEDFFNDFDGNVSKFPQFKSKLDELVNDWKKETKVIDIAKMMNLLEVYQQILHAFAKVIPAIKPEGRVKLAKKMNEVKSRLPYFFQYISYRDNGWDILTIDVTARDCREDLLRDGLQYILKSFVVEMKTIFEEELFFEISKKLVYPKLLSDWVRIRHLSLRKYS
ncbi:MAG: hypothetical protein ACFFD2_30010, partial [Promethearchaeota archaeon]